MTDFELGGEERMCLGSALQLRLRIAIALPANDITETARSVHAACTQRASRLGPVPRAHVPRCVSEGGAAGAASAAGRMALPPASVCACLHQRGWLLSVPPLTSFASLLALCIALGGCPTVPVGSRTVRRFLPLL